MVNQFITLICAELKPIDVNYHKSAINPIQPPFLQNQSHQPSISLASPPRRGCARRLSEEDLHQAAVEAAAALCGIFGLAGESLQSMG